MSRQKNPPTGPRHLTTMPLTEKGLTWAGKLSKLIPPRSLKNAVPGPSFPTSSPSRALAVSLGDSQWVPGHKNAFSLRLALYVVADPCCKLTAFKPIYFPLHMFFHEKLNTDHLFQPLDFHFFGTLLISIELIPGGSLGFFLR